MFICTITCNWKCCKEGGFSPSTCQNNPWKNERIVSIDDEKIISRYLSNPITKAVVFGGLEPFLQPSELISFIRKFRRVSNDDIVIYTGYYPNEVKKWVDVISSYGNIIIKYGRYKPNKPSIYDSILGVTLVSDNQFAVFYE